jgi:hypothetical protein
MNRIPPMPVERPIRRALPRLAAPLILLSCLPFLQQCVSVDGGAIELSWALRTTDGEVTNCFDARVEGIRVSWSVEVSATRTLSFHASFRCDDDSGATSFDVPAGTASITVAPECADGNVAAIDTYEAPPPIVRRIREGEVATLDALLIAVRTSSCDTRPCVCR